MDGSVIRREMPADLDTPVTAFLKLQPAGARFLLESVEQGERVGRYSFVGVGALREVVVREERAVVREGGVASESDLDGREPLEVVRSAMPSPGTPARSLDGRSGALVGAAVGFLSFEYVRRIERTPALPVVGPEFPEAAFLVPRVVVAFDHARRTLAVSAQQGEADVVEDVLARLRGPLPERVPRSASSRTTFSGNRDEGSFGAKVEAAKERIFAGDIFQVVLSHRLDARTSLDPFTLYRALRMRNPSPYSYFLDFDPFRIVGTSPEALCRLEGRRATVRPIAGTRRRGEDPEADEALARELESDPKEAAEHVMLVDLGRNDLSRVCEPGTVRVDAFRTIERFSHVMHLVSYVSGDLSAGHDARDLLRATFPAGTVSGAPKVRAIEILSELEEEARGPYAGAVGYFASGGDADFAIPIRTAFFAGDALRLQAGAGIVADSDPRREYAETQEKLEALREAVSVAEAMFP
jgi:anthranilate synthase component 1